MQRPEKEQIVSELTERLRSSDTLIVADYRGLSVKEIDDLRTKLIEQGADFTVVKNSLTRRAAEADSEAAQEPVAEAATEETEPAGDTEADAAEEDKEE